MITGSAKQQQMQLQKSRQTDSNKTYSKCL